MRRAHSVVLQTIGLLLLAPLAITPVLAQTPAGRKQPATLADLSASIEDLA